MPKVYVAKCDDYDQHHISAAIADGIAALGGIDALIGAGNCVAVKPNLLKAVHPSVCATTHPSVVQGVLEAVVRGGKVAKVVESPAGAYAAKNVGDVYKATGIAKAAKAAGASLNDDFSVEEVHVEHGQSVKHLRIIKAILDADSVITVAKLKTHGMLTYTGATKNLFGVVPGLSKPECHLRLPQKQDFAGMIVDIAEFVRPRLSVIDAVWAMECNGPLAGEKRYVGALIMSESPYAADMVGSRIIGLDWRDNPVVAEAVRRGLCREDDIEIVGDGIKEVTTTDFVKPDVHDVDILRGRIPEPLANPLRKWLVLYPKFDLARCIGCGYCAKSCPNDAITMKNNLPELNRRKCINCFCCHELCPQKAVDIHRPLVLKAAIKVFQ